MRKPAVNMNIRAGIVRTALASAILVLAGCATTQAPEQRSASGQAPAAAGAEPTIQDQSPTQPGAPALPSSKSPAEQAAAQAAAKPGASAASSESESAEAAGKESRQRASKPTLIRGDDNVIAPAQPQTVKPGKAQESSFKFEQAPVREVVHAILSELLGYSYVLHQPIGGTVTISTAAPVPADEALMLLESALQANGLVMVRDRAGVFHVGPPDAVRGIVPSLGRIEQSPVPPGFGMVIVPLKFIGAPEMAEILKPVARPESFLRVDSVRNLLLLAGTRNQIEGWLEMVRTFDVDLLKGMSVGIFPLQYASVRDIEAAVRALSPDALPTAAASGSAGGPAVSPRQPLLGTLRVIPLERLNSVLVVTPRAAYLDEVKKWIDKLDRPSETEAEPRLFVYPVQNGSAEHLAEILNSIYGGGTASPRAAGGTGAGTGVAPGLRPVTGSTAQSDRATTAAAGSALGALPAASAGAIASAMGAAPQGTARTGTGAVSALALGSNIRIVGDDRKNAVIVYAPPSEFKRIEETLRRLDTPAPQVLIEATIVEVSLTDDLQYGLEWYFTDKPRHGLVGTGQLNLGQSGAIGPSQPGFSYSLTNSLGQIRAVLNALADRSLVRVISSPSLVVLDNHTATIMVGDQQPVQSSETITNGGNVITSIQYKDTGVNLSVTPSVNSGDVVTMLVNQAITDVGAIDAATGQRAFLQRQVTSRVAVRSGEAFVIGGLIRDSSTGGSTGVPFLSQIPVLGALFGAQTRNAARTELLIVITPRVVRTPQDARDIAGEMRERMSGFKSLVEEQHRLLPKGFGAGAPGPVPSQEEARPK